VASSAYNRGQVIYRLAEMAESRRDELANHVGAAEGLGEQQAEQSVSRAIDRIIWYAGGRQDRSGLRWGHPSRGRSSTSPCPRPRRGGCPGEPGIVTRGIRRRGARPIAAGNTVVSVASELRPTPAVLLGEMTATSDFPAGS